MHPFEAAPLTCAGVTTYKAVKVSGTRRSDLVAVFGIGGLGHLAVQYARVAGAAVVAVDLFEDKLRLAKELGADYAVNASEQDPVEETKELGSWAGTSIPRSSRRCWDTPAPPSPWIPTRMPSLRFKMAPPVL